MCYSDDGFLHIAGTYVGTIYVDSIILQSSGGADIFVSQIDDEGNFIWVESAGGTLEDWVKDCEVSNQGVVHLIGMIEGVSAFGTTNLTSNGSTDMFHATINQAGDWQSAHNYGGPGNEKAESLVIDDRGNVIITGTYSSTFYLGFDELQDKDGDEYKTDVFVGQLDSSNQWYWAISAGGSGNDESYSIQFDAQENPTIGLSIENTANISNYTLTSDAYGDIVIWNYARDHDSDGFTDGQDNCPRVANPQQIDTDGDLIGECAMGMTMEILSQMIGMIALLANLVGPPRQIPTMIVMVVRIQLRILTMTKMVFLTTMISVLKDLLAGSLLWKTMRIKTAVKM